MSEYLSGNATLTASRIICVCATSGGGRLAVCRRMSDHDDRYSPLKLCRHGALRSHFHRSECAPQLVQAVRLSVARVDMPALLRPSGVRPQIDRAERARVRSAQIRLASARPLSMRNGWLSDKPRAWEAAKTSLPCGTSPNKDDNSVSILRTVPLPQTFRWCAPRTRRCRAPIRVEHTVCRHTGEERAPVAAAPMALSEAIPIAASISRKYPARNKRDPEATSASTNDARLDPPTGERSPERPYGQAQREPPARGQPRLTACAETAEATLIHRAASPEPCLNAMCIAPPLRNKANRQPRCSRMDRNASFPSSSAQRTDR